MTEYSVHLISHIGHLRYLFDSCFDWLTYEMVGTAD